MMFINIVRTITEYKYADNIRAIFGTERDRLTNIILAVMVYIKERTLSEDLDCTISDVKRFLEDVSHVFSDNVLYDPALLAKYIIVDVLQNGGEISTFQTFNSHTMLFEIIPVRLIDEEHGKYTLTDDAFDFLFRIKDIDSTLDYSVTRFKMQEYMKRDNYSEALQQSRELVSRIRSIKTGINNFILRCRENISKVSVDEYESLVMRIRSLLEDEYKELIDIQKNAEERAAKLSNATTVGVTYEEAEIYELLLDPALLFGVSDTLAPYIIYQYLSFELYMKYAGINSALMTLDLSVYLDDLKCHLLIISSEDDRIAHPNVSKLLSEKIKHSVLWMRPHAEHHNVIAGDAEVYEKIMSSIEYALFKR